MAVNQDLKDTLLDIEWEKGNGLWERKLRYLHVGKGFTLLLILIVIIVLNHYHEEETSLTWNKVKKGDSLFLNDVFVRDSSYKALSYNRLIRPINEADIDRMHIPVSKKRKMYAELDTTKKDSFMLYASDILIIRDSIFKNGTAAIGSYLKKDSTTKTFKTTSSDKWYAVLPNPKVTEKDFVVNLPDGYVYANEYYYLAADDVTLQEPDAIKNYKSKFTQKTVVDTVIKSSPIVKKPLAAKTKNLKKIRKARKHKTKIIT